jgi:outer membrane protein assembly factor BamB
VTRRRPGAIAVAAAVAAALAAGGGPASAAEVTGASEDLRTSWYPDEPSLTPTLVGGGRFETAFDDKLAGEIYAQPLIANGTLLVVTEDNWAYGLDPVTGAVRWSRQFGTAVESASARQSNATTSNRASASRGLP